MTLELKNRFSALLTILLTFNGGVILLVLLFNRFIRARLPRDLHLFYIENSILVDNQSILLISLGIMLFSFIKLFLLLKKRYWVNKNPNTVFMFIQEKIKPMLTFMEDSIHAFYFNVFVLKILPKIFKGRNLYEDLERLCFYLFYHYNNFLQYIMIIQVLPRIIIYLTFLIEIIFYFKFVWFYKALFLLIIPMIHNVLIYFLNDFATFNVTNLNKRLCKKSFNVGTSEEYHKITLVDPNDYLAKDPQALYITIQKHRNVCTFSEYFLRYSLVKKLLCDFWLSLSINLILCIGWGYVLVYNCLMFFDNISIGNPWLF